MEVIECKHNVRCELGACGNKATHAVKFDRVGLRSRLYACEKCLRELHGAISAVLPPPKSVETARRKEKKNKEQA